MVMPKIPKYTPFLLILLLFNVSKESFASSFIPIDNYLVACGSSHDITFQGRIFIPEFKFNHSNLQIIANKSVAVTSKLNSTLSPLYNSAQLFYEKASYKFKIQQHGRHWIRLYFHPLPDYNPNMTLASITVITDSFVLLDNFSFAHYTSSHLVKEYVINITSDELSLTFIPQNNSLVFVNAVEVISISDELLLDHIVVTLYQSDLSEQFSKSALETVYRVNIGGATLSDTLGRTWENDEYYFQHPINTANSSYHIVSTNPSAIKYSVAAPPSVYASARAWKIASQSQGYDLSWIFNVDSDFMYFVRVHFCDIINNSLNNGMVFNLVINGAFAVQSLDLSSKTRGLAVPYYFDFISYSSRNTFEVSVSVDPDTMTDTSNAIMNGVEILKISNSAGRLNEFSSFPDFDSSLPENEASVSHSPKKTSKISTKLGIWWTVILIGCSVSVLAFLAFGGLSFCYLKGRWRKNKSKIHWRRTITTWNYNNAYPRPQFPFCWIPAAYYQPYYGISRQLIPTTHLKRTQFHDVVGISRTMSPYFNFKHRSYNKSGRITQRSNIFGLRASVTAFQAGKVEDLDVLVKEFVAADGEEKNAEFLAAERWSFELLVTIDDFKTRVKRLLSSSFLDLTLQTLVYLPKSCQGVLIPLRTSMMGRNYGSLQLDLKICGKWVSATGNILSSLFLTNRYGLGKSPSEFMISQLPESRTRMKLKCKAKRPVEEPSHEEPLS
ncbi:hypothetical protein P8452_75374 [Trifolium repens]|nr:hypothetical protein P8452_75374 [Trifolium repens]WJX93897.1 hypothetical protein P8452_75374 [Trifolium repens]